MTPIRIGIIGTGFGGSVQLPALLGMPDVTVQGIASRTPEKAAALAERFALPLRFASAEELIGSPEIDFVSIASPQSTHAGLVAKAVDAGKAILCEKPFTLSHGEAEPLMKAAEAKGIFHAVDFEFRETDSWAFFKTQIDQGVLGNIVSAEYRWESGSWADPSRPFGWQCDASRGGGVVSALGVHLFDAMEWMLGKAVSVEASTRIAVPVRPSADGTPTAVTAEDGVQALFLLERGIPVTMSVTNTDPSGAGLAMTVRGDKGTLRLKSVSREYGRGERVTLENNDGEKTVFEGGAEGDADPRITLFRTFAARMLQAYAAGRTDFSPSFAAGARTRLLQDAVLQSEGSRVDIGGSPK